MNDFHRLDWFLAQICFEIYLLRLSWVGGKVERKLEDYLMKFSQKKDEKPKSEFLRTPEEVQAEIEKNSQDMKSFFFGMLGIGPDGKATGAVHHPKQPVLNDLPNLGKKP